MGDVHIAGPSLLLARHDTAHREHHHQHNLLHRQQATVVKSVVTEAVVTISVVQQINVDTNGNTIGLQTFLADSTGGILTIPVPTLDSPLPSATPPAGPGTGISPSLSSALPTGAGGELANNAASQSVLSIQSVASSQAAATTPILSIPSSYSLRPNSNSTASASSSNSFTRNFSNSSTSVSTLSSSTSLLSSISITSGSSTSDESSTTSAPPTSTSSFYSPSSSSTQLATPIGIVPIAGTGTVTGSSPSNTAAAGGGAVNDSTPSTPVVVGGVVGSVAGVAVLIFALIFFIRWKKRNQSMLALGEGEGPESAARALPPSQPPGGMAERSSRLSSAFVVPAALASLTGFKRSSRQTDRTVSSTAGSERGFYRVSGRKLPSVLQTGGDGYGDGIAESNTMSGSSFYRDSQGFYGGPGGLASPPAGLSMQRDSGIPIMREGPARTPVTEHGPFAATPGPLTPPPPRRPDQVGRSHPSLDGSQRSRFTEEV